MTTWDTYAPGTGYMRNYITIREWTIPTCANHAGAPDQLATPKDGNHRRRKKIALPEELVGKRLIRDRKLIHDFLGIYHIERNRVPVVVPVGIAIQVYRSHLESPLSHALPAAYGRMVEQCVVRALSHPNQVYETYTRLVQTEHEWDERIVIRVYKLD